MIFLRLPPNSPVRPKKKLQFQIPKPDTKVSSFLTSVFEQIARHQGQQLPNLPVRTDRDILKEEFFREWSFYEELRQSEPSKT